MAPFLRERSLARRRVICRRLALAARGCAPLAAQDPEFKVPFDKYGAVRPIGSGKTPEGLPMGLRAFSPAERE